MSPGVLPSLISYRTRRDSSPRCQIKLIDKDIDHANPIVLAQPVFHTLRRESALSTIDVFDEAFNRSPHSANATQQSRRLACFYATMVRPTRGEHHGQRT